MDNLIEALIHWDKEMLLTLHQMSTPWLDTAMAAITEKYHWIPLYLLLLIMLYRQFGWHFVYSVVAIVLLISLSDQLTSSVMKPLFARDRPCHDPEIGHLVRIITKCGGPYGFVSSHASNSMALTTFIFLIFRQKYPWIFWLILWPLSVSYSRIYLGVHYPLDILGGLLVGILIGFFIFKITFWLSKRVPFKFAPIKN